MLRRKESGEGLPVVKGSPKLSSAVTHITSEDATKACIAFDAYDRGKPAELVTRKSGAKRRDVTRSLRVGNGLFRSQ